MLVRFKKEYCADKDNPMFYELVSDDTVEVFNEYAGEWEEFYDVKLLGLIPFHKMEEADGTELPAIDVYIKSR